jgi:putative MATE family efflux protein
LSTIWKLSAPTVAVMVIQGLVNTAEVYLVGRLGASAIAGAALCFPMMMLMSAMSGAGLGGGVSSAIARSIGARNPERARLLAIHSIVLGLVFGLFFTVVMELFGEALFHTMGGSADALRQALAYSNAFFRGVIVVWLFNTLTSIFRGLGQPEFPAKVGVVGAAVIIVASPSLIFGIGPVPALGIAGAGVAVIIYTATASLVLLWRLFSAQSPLRLSLEGFHFERELFWEILRVGLPSALNTVVGSMGFMVMTGLVGRFGTTGLAAFGLGSRFEFVLIPVVFGLGTAVVTLVGAAMGAQNLARAKAVTKTSTVIGVVLWGVAGVILVAFPRLWLGMFTSDPEVLLVGSQYLRTVGPFYPLVGVGMILYFACQGLGQATLPLILSVGRFAIALVLGWAVVHFGGGIGSVFAAVAAGLVIYSFSLILTIYVTFRKLEAS